VACSFFVSSVTFADAYGDLMKAPTAFQGAKSWHAEEHFSHGDVSMIRKGTPTKLPIGGMMSSKMIKNVPDRIGSASEADRA